MSFTWIRKAYYFLVHIETSPPQVQISQIFGEVWPGAILESKLNGNKLTVIPVFWRNIRFKVVKGYSERILVVELRLGMGTLMADILRVRTERFSLYCHYVFSILIPNKSIRVHLVEISPRICLGRWWFLCLAGWIENNNTYSETVLRIWRVAWYIEEKSTSQWIFFSLFLV